MVTGGLAALPSPTALVERGVVERNITGMAERAARLGVALRPHAKTHKSPAIAARQLAAGAVGLTVASLHEAETFAAAGVDDILLAHPPVGAGKLDRLARLAGRVRLRVTVESLDAVTALAEAARRAGTRIGWLWEIDCGARRCGTLPGTPTADAVVAAARATSDASFDGLLAFGGHVYAARSAAELKAAALDERDAVRSTAELIEAAGLEVRVRSIGTTPTVHALEEAEGITELRPGNYVFNDATQVALGVVPVAGCALSVLGTVVARPAADRLILDCGSKALAAERMTPLTATFGLVAGRPELRVERLYEEHAVVTTGAPVEDRPGDRLRLIPNHACAAVNLHEQLVVVDDGDVVERWEIEARGWGFER